VVAIEIDGRSRFGNGVSIFTENGAQWTAGRAPRRA
jgi:hypothetical protein